MADEMRKPDVQGLPAMELGGFEPPTSWVRSRLADQLEMAHLQVIRRLWLRRR